MPPLPSLHAAAALALTLVAFGLFATGRMRVELVCLLVIAVLALGFYLFPLEREEQFTGMEVAFGGFSHEALVAICSLMILGRALVVTGALEPAALALARIWHHNRSLGMLSTLVVCGGISMFVNDTPVLVLALPILLGLASHAGVSPSKTLMPANAAILIGGMATTIGTSTNLLVVSIAADLGHEIPGVFSFTPIALTAALIALPYLWLIMPRLLPAASGTEARPPRTFEAMLHVTGTTVGVGEHPGSFARRIGKDASLAAVISRDRRHYKTEARAVASGDSLHVSGTAEALRRVSERLRAPLAEPLVLDNVRASAQALGEDQRIAEVVVGASSELAGQSVKTARISERYDVAVLGASRTTDTPGRARIPLAEQLEPGDILLVQGAPSRLKELETGEGVLLLEGARDLPHSAKAPLALAIVAAVVLLAATRTLPVAIAALAGTIAVFATGCLRFQGIGRALSLEVIVLVAASIALGRALVETGAAEWLGAAFATTLTGAPAPAVIAALMAFITVLTNFVSNAAAAAVGTPVAVSLAGKLGIPAEPLVLAVLFGCNLCYVTPMAYQTNLMIMGAAQYRFSDFVRAGLPLAVLMIGSLAILLVRHYDL